MSSRWRRWLRGRSFQFALLLIALLDELVFSAREAAWPLIRDELQLDYFQIGILLGAPNLVSTIVEPVIGILGDVWKRRVLVLGGGALYAVALVVVAASGSFWALLLAFSLLWPASGAFVSLSQATLMDSDPSRREQNMARWTFAGSVGVVAGPFAFLAANASGLGWRGLFLIFVGFILAAIALARQIYFPPARTRKESDAAPGRTQLDFRTALKEALQTLRTFAFLRWLILLEASDLMLDILFGFLALYFVDVVGLDPTQAGLAVAVWTGVGLIGDLLIIPLLECVSGLVYLRMSAALVLVVYPAMLLINPLQLKLVLLAVLGLLNAGWYAILQGQLYNALPERSGSVMTVTGIFGLVAVILPILIGLVAREFGLAAAMWTLALAPLGLLIGLPRGRKSPITDRQ